MEQGEPEIEEQKEPSEVEQSDPEGEKIEPGDPDEPEGEPIEQPIFFADGVETGGQEEQGEPEEVEQAGQSEPEEVELEQDPQEMK